MTSCRRIATHSPRSAQHLVRQAALVTALLLPLSASAQAPPAAPPPPPSGDVQLEYFRTALSTAQPNDRTLHKLQLGLAAMQADNTPVARESFEDALTQIEAFYSDSESAKKARSVWTPESSKDFKGEPYERAMAYYYRGLVALDEGDYQNARASFKGGVLQDSMSEKEEFRADFALLDFLSAWASTCNGDEKIADEAYITASQSRPQMSRPDSGDDVLIVVETGAAPIKFATGEYQEELRFKPGFVLEEEVVDVTIGDLHPSSRIQENVFFQATTRGGREIDAVLEGKAQIKSGTSTAGTALMVAGTTMASVASNTNIAGIGGGIALAGLIAHAVADAMNPEADIRAWQSLPNQVSVYTVPKKDVKNAPVRVQFRDADGNLDWVQLPVPQRSGCSVVWVRSSAGEARAFGRIFRGGAA